MSNPWFRMYSEFSHDPKVQTMSESMQRRYIMIMCMRCSNELVTLHETDIAFYLRISNEELAESKALFISKGFVDSSWNLLNWEKRQFISDTSNARVAKHRALQKAKHQDNGNADVTLQKRKSNALEQNRTDTDKKHPSSSPDGFDLFWHAYPKKVSKPAALTAFKKAKINGQLSVVIDDIDERKSSADWQKESGQFIPNPATYLNQRRWEDEIKVQTTQMAGFV
jgi:hypothetical protein